MKPEKKSYNLLSVARAKAKMFEYSIPEDEHIKITENPSKLFTISIGLLGDFSASINRGESGNEYLSELKNNLLFSAHFFDAYYQSKLQEVLDFYLILLGSASYYLCDLPGCSQVLAKTIDFHIINLNCNDLEKLLLWILQSNLDMEIQFQGIFNKYIVSIQTILRKFFKVEGNDDEFIKLSEDFRRTVYEKGIPRELLLTDVIIAVTRKKLEHSARKMLPEYSGLSERTWNTYLKKDSSIKEFWPAQQLLGKADVLKGKSAIVQMPTSAGKTKSAELIIRSAFLSGRTSLAVIVAPFRALCNEIKNSFIDVFHNESIKVDELSDVLQIDFEISSLLEDEQKQILVVTPEKLLYILRHNSELAKHIGLLIFDEGHQFDSGSRGITYELLLTSLNFMIPADTQKVLISAVISNAESIGEWLNRESNVAEGTTLPPTFKSIAFVSWLDQLGRIEYVSSNDIDKKEFFVPRVIEKITLEKKGRERKYRFFPEKNDGKSIALYLGLKLVGNGSIAVFCGRRDTATKICEQFIKDIIERRAPLSSPLKFSNKEEVKRLANLYFANLGESVVSKSAEHGVFSHHGNIPHGIRLAVEHAMRENLIRFVVCTSTLAQGVNLPIRYLILTSIYQAGERIKVRDFHNLIGRAGRAGMHTEGSILFVDPDVYDKKNNYREKWRWHQVKDLLNPNNSEPCISNLLSIFDPLKSDDRKSTIPIDILSFLKSYIKHPDKIDNLIHDIVNKYSTGVSFNGVKKQIEWRVNLVCSIESFLLSAWDESKGEFSEIDIIRLAEGTLAFFLADEQKKELIRVLFKILAENIATRITDLNRRRIYGKTLYGIQESKIIEEWLAKHVDKLILAQDRNAIFDLLWEIIKDHVRNKSFNKFDKKDILAEIAKKWIDGESFKELYRIAESQDCKIGNRKITIEHIVDICEGGIAYDGSLLVGALAEFIVLLDRNDTEELFNNLQLFQKYLKYGLSTETSMSLYELSFADRVIVQDLEASLGLTATKKNLLIEELKQNSKKVKEVMAKYPSYFQNEVLKILAIS